MQGLAVWLFEVLIALLTACDIATSVACDTAIAHLQHDVFSMHLRCICMWSHHLRVLPGLTYFVGLKQLMDTHAARLLQIHT